MLGVLLIVTACGTPSQEINTPVSGEYCAVFDAIKSSSRDTPQTLGQIKKHNASFCCICPEVYPTQCEVMLGQLGGAGEACGGV